MKGVKKWALEIVPVIALNPLLPISKTLSTQVTRYNQLRPFSGGIGSFIGRIASI